MGMKLDSTHVGMNMDFLPMVDKNNSSQQNRTNSGSGAAYTGKNSDNKPPITINTRGWG